MKLSKGRDLPKLVRDNIPQIIKRKTGRTPNISIAKHNHVYLSFLLKKLIEEAYEAQATTSKAELVKELADIKEVIITLMNLIDISDDKVEKNRIAKKEKNGGFEKRYILQKTSQAN